MASHICLLFSFDRSMTESEFILINKQDIWPHKLKRKIVYWNQNLTIRPNNWILLIVTNYYR